MGSFERVTASIHNLGRFSPEQVSVLIDRLKSLHLEKDEHLIREGQVCQCFYFVNEGCFRHYVVTDSGEEAMLNLFIPGEWMFEYKSLVSQQPSQNIIQAAA